jgi:hypothetical protein
VCKLSELRNSVYFALYIRRKMTLSQCHVSVVTMVSLLELKRVIRTMTLFIIKMVMDLGWVQGLRSE